LPGGTFTHWDIAAFPRRTPNSDVRTDSRYRQNIAHGVLSNSGDSVSHYFLFPAPVASRALITFMEYASKDSWTLSPIIPAKYTTKAPILTAINTFSNEFTSAHFRSY